MNEDANAKTVQEIYAAYRQGDIAGILARLDESIVFTIQGSPAVPLAGTRRGHDGMRHFFTELARTHEFSTFEPREYIAQGNRVVVLVRYEGRNLATGRSFSTESAMVWTLQNGKAVRFVEYTDTEQLARAAQPAVKAMAAH